MLHTYIDKAQPELRTIQTCEAHQETEIGNTRYWGHRKSSHASSRGALYTPVACVGTYMGSVHRERAWAGRRVKKLLSASWEQQRLLYKKRLIESSQALWGTRDTEVPQTAGLIKGESGLDVASHSGEPYSDCIPMTSCQLRNSDVILRRSFFSFIYLFTYCQRIETPMNSVNTGYDHICHCTFVVGLIFHCWFYSICKPFISTQATCPKYPVTEAGNQVHMGRAIY